MTPDPLAALRDLLDRVAPFDPAPDGGAAVVVEMRAGAATERFVLTEYAGRALYEALNSYYDPSDAGPCDRCGGPRLDENMRCRDCGHVSGVFGQVLLEHAERLRDDDRHLSTGPEV